jgi:hypothetical protein
LCRTELEWKFCTHYALSESEVQTGSIIILTAMVQHALHNCATTPKIGADDTGNSSTLIRSDGVWQLAPQTLVRNHD